MSDHDEIPLAKFQELSGLSDRSVMWLLTHNRLPCSYTAQEGICVDISKIAIDELVLAVANFQSQRTPGARQLFREKIRTLVATHVTEALERAFATLDSSGPLTLTRDSVGDKSDGED